MPNDHDDDALTWDDGTDDATHVDGRPPAAASVAAPGAGSASLVVYGILAGAYLLFTVGWIIAAGQDTYTVPNLLGEVMYQLGQFLAIAAPVLWFAMTLVLARRRSAVVRVMWLVVGAILLAPWPFILSGIGA